VSSPAAGDQITAAFGLSILTGQSGTFTTTFTAQSSKSGTLTFPVPFTTAPVVTWGVQVGSNLDILINAVTVTNAAVSWRAFQVNGTNVTGTVTVHWIAEGV
jgi:hypothetical protein